MEAQSGNMKPKSNLEKTKIDVLRLGDVVYYVTDDGDRCAAIVTGVLPGSIVHLYIIAPYNTGHRMNVPHSPTGTVRRSWHIRDVLDSALIESKGGA